jgi:hypothetical protein
MDTSRMEREIDLVGLRNELFRMGRKPRPEIPGSLQDLELDFLQEVLLFETAPEIPYREMLAQRGVRLAPVADLDDEGLSSALIRLISELAQVRVFLAHTDHLSDRDLYGQLCVMFDRMSFKVLPQELGPWNCFLDLAGGPADVDLREWLRFYATERERTEWSQRHPTLDLPPRERTPHDRDRYLPGPTRLG